MIALLDREVVGGYLLDDEGGGLVSLDDLERLRFAMPITPPPLLLLLPALSSIVCDCMGLKKAYAFFLSFLLLLMLCMN